MMAHGEIREVGKQTVDRELIDSELHEFRKTLESRRQVVDPKSKRMHGQAMPVRRRYQAGIFNMPVAVYSVQKVDPGADAIDRIG